jgi:hypothetical protein
MEFSKKKLPREELPKLYRMRIDSVKPYALMLAPVYLYLKANGKFVAVKGPLDFFTEAELARLESFRYFYCSEFIKFILAARQAGEKARNILTQQVAEPKPTPEDPFPAVELSPTPYELSNAMIKIIGPFWWESKEGVSVDPYSITVFVNELCKLLPVDRLLKAREKSFENYDLALYRSSWTVFLALHLGYCDLDFLNELRVRVFDDNIKGDPYVSNESEVEELIAASYASLRSSRVHQIKSDFFFKSPEKVALKIVGRIQRIKDEFVSTGDEIPSIYGERGFIDE